MSATTSATIPTIVRSLGCSPGPSITSLVGSPLEAMFLLLSGRRRENGRTESGHRRMTGKDQASLAYLEGTPASEVSRKTLARPDQARPYAAGRRARCPNKRGWMPRGRLVRGDTSERGRLARGDTSGRRRRRGPLGWARIYG